jgi:hypothetical protein
VEPVVLRRLFVRGGRRHRYPRVRDGPTALVHDDPGDRRSALQAHRPRDLAARNPGEDHRRGREAIGHDLDRLRLLEVLDRHRPVRSHLLSRGHVAHEERHLPLDRPAALVDQSKEDSRRQREREVHAPLGRARARDHDVDLLGSAEPGLRRDDDVGAVERQSVEDERAVGPRRGSQRFQGAAVREP